MAPLLPVTRLHIVFPRLKWSVQEGQATASPESHNERLFWRKKGLLVEEEKKEARLRSLLAEPH